MAHDPPDPIDRKALDAERLQLVKSWHCGGTCGKEIVRLWSTSAGETFWWAEAKQRLSGKDVASIRRQVGRLKHTYAGGAQLHVQFATTMTPWPVTLKALCPQHGPQEIVINPPH